MILSGEGAIPSSDKKLGKTRKYLTGKTAGTSEHSNLIPLKYKLYAQ
jgi:hypothetical protein